MDNCLCPEPEAIPDIPEVTCPEDLGQVVRLIIARRGTQLAATVAAAKLLATYTALVAETDETKIVFTPKLLEGVTIPPGEPITQGGDDNSTPLGRQIVVGASTIITEGMLRGVNSAVIAAMRGLRCFDLGMALINEFGEIGAQMNGLTVEVIPTHAFFIGDKGNAGKNTQDQAKIRWGFDAGWRDGLVLIKPTDFDPRFVTF